MNDLTNAFEALDATQIQKFVDDSRQEDVHLDFKCVDDHRLSKREDRKNLAIAASGFANSDGGLVVWGVDARKDGPDSPDTARELCPIDSLSVFVSRLQELTADCTSPKLEGIRHRAIPRSADTGFAASLFPASDSGPHMAKLGEDRYYKRAGTSFYVMEHFDVADMFGRRRRPMLAFAYSVERGITISGPTTTYFVKIRLGVANNGRAVALYPFFAAVISPSPPFELKGVTLHENAPGTPRRVPASNGIQRLLFEGGSDNAVHIDSTAFYGHAEIAISEGTKQVADLTIEYRIAAADHPPREGVATIKSEELLAAIPKP